MDKSINIALRYILTVLLIRVLGKEPSSNIYKNNDCIKEDELNYTVQQTIARIIFLRIA